MRIQRSQRIIQTLEALNRTSIMTAHAIAQELGVSERTVYRYIKDLIQKGYPIEGEAGVGYRLRIRHDPKRCLIPDPEYIGRNGHDNSGAHRATVVRRRRT